MTWTKLGDEFIDQCASLSDAAFRAHVEGIAYAYRTESLRIPARLAERFAGKAAAMELADLKFWRIAGKDWEIVHHADVIRESLAAQARRREQNRAAQRAFRQRHVSDYVSDYGSLTSSLTPGSGTGIQVGEGSTTAGASETPGTTRARSSREVSSKVQPLRKGKGHPLTETVKQEIKRLVDGGMPRAEVARTLGIGLTTVYHHAPPSDGSVAFTS